VGHVIESYLDELGALLDTSVHRRGAILRELEDGLWEAVCDNVDRGMSPAQAALAATSSFGSPVIVAREFEGELATARTRRTAVLLLRTGPVVGLLWLATAATSHMGPPAWKGPWVALPAVALALLVGIPAAMLAVAATGRLGLRIPTLRALAPVAAATSGMLAVAIDLTLLGTAAAFLVTAPGAPPWGLLACACAASLGRLALAGRASRRCLADRTASTVA
jgi:hypothetical protein